MIEKVYLNNFKCHRAFEQTLSELTILTGSNAVGKSSIIQAILLAQKSYEKLEEKQVKTNDVYGINLGLPISIISENFEREELKIGFKLAGIHKENEVILSLNDLENNEAYFKIENVEEMIEQDHNVKKNRIFYINAERIGPRIIYGINVNKTDYVGSQGEHTGYVINEMDKQQRLNNVKYTLPEILRSSKIARFSANCEAWMQEIIPGTTLQCNVDMEKNISVIKFQNEGDFYLPTATGFGISYVLPIVVQGLVASMMENAIIIVENPEAHLHPYSQSTIGKFLALLSTCGVQVIIETHSEHVIDGCRLQLAYMKQCEKMQTLFFTKEDRESNYTVIQTLENGELEQWPEGFFDQKRQDLRKLLEMRICGK